MIFDRDSAVDLECVSITCLVNHALVRRFFVMVQRDGGKRIKGVAAIDDVA